MGNEGIGGGGSHAHVPGLASLCERISHASPKSTSLTAASASFEVRRRFSGLTVQLRVMVRARVRARVGGRV